MLTHQIFYLYYKGNGVNYLGCWCRIMAFLSIPLEIDFHHNEINKQNYENKPYLKISGTGLD